MARISDTEDYYTRLFGGGDSGDSGGSSAGDGSNQFGVTDPTARDNTQYPTAGAGNPNPTNLQATPDWLQQTLNSGVSAEEAAKTYNTVFGRTSGNEAVVYPNTNGGGQTTIGLPSGYFTQEGQPQIGPGLTSWGFTERGPETGGGGSGGGTGFGGYVAPPPTQSQTGFADPAYQQLLDLANRRINQLQQPQSNPQMEAYFASLMQEKELAKQRAQTFADQLTARIGQLQQPLLSDTDSARIRAQYQNGTQNERDRALAANRERLAIRGFDPRTSGLLEGTNRATNAAYDARTGNIDATLANQAIAADEQRRNQATTLQQLAYNALSGGDLSSLQQQATASDLERTQLADQQARERELLTTAGIPVELSNTGLQNALATLGSGGNGTSALQSLFGALGLSQQQQSIDSANTASLFGGAGGLLASILPYILPKK